MARVVEIPVARNDAAFAHHARVKLRAGIGRHDVEGRGGYAVFDGPVDGALKNVVTIVIHAEDEAAVDHDAE